MPRRPLVLAAVAVVLALIVAGVVWSRSNPSGPGDRTTNQTSVPPVPTPTPLGLGPPAGPGRLGVTVLDRRTGAVWAAGSPDHLMWASSTPKLALATNLPERARAGEITLDPAARSQLAAMLAVSDDNAADALWNRYGGAAQLARFRAYG